MLARPTSITVAPSFAASISVTPPRASTDGTTVLRVETETLDERGERCAYDHRYFISSLPSARLSAAQWLLVVRRHWGVETSHQILDTAFDEDAHPWIEQNPRATAVVIVLRRIAYTLFALWRYISLRSDENHVRTWHSVMRDVLVTLLTASAEQLVGLRQLARGPPRPTHA